MILTSSAFLEGDRIPQQYAANGANISPPLQWADMPENTKSLVLIMHDPDVPPTLRPDGNFDHWVVFNIPPTITSLIAGETKIGTCGSNSRGIAAYTGPKPPYGVHRYFFTLYALDALINLPIGANRAQVETAIQNHILAQVVLMGRYECID